MRAAVVRVRRTGDVSSRGRSGPWPVAGSVRWPGRNRPA